MKLSQNFSLEISFNVKLTLKIPADSAILSIYIEENLWGKVVVATFLSIKIQKEDLTMTMGRRNDSIGSARLGRSIMPFTLYVKSFLTIISKTEY